MATVTATWNTGSGNWFSASNWDEPNPNPPPPLLHYVPGGNEDVSIPDHSGVGTPFTISYDGTSTVNTLTGTPVVTLNILGGTLTSTNGGNPFGTVNVAANASFVSSQGVQSFSSGAISGTLGGGGTFRFVNGTFDINAGARITVDTWLLTHQIGSGTVSTTNINADLTYANTFQLLDVFGNYPILRLNAHTLTLSGTATLDGRIEGPGTVRLTGSGEVVGGSLEDGARLQVVGSAAQTGSIGVDGSIRVEAGATYAITTASDIAGQGTNGLTLSNGGSFRATGAGTSTVSGDFTNNGTLTVGAGAVLSLNAGTQTLNGNVNGAGTLNLGFAHDTTLNTVTLNVGAIRVAGGNGGGTVRLAKDIVYAGRFTLDDTGIFDLNGRTFTLSGTTALNSGTVDGPGTLKITGTATVANVGFGYGGSPVTVQNAGTITQTGSVSLNGTLVNDAGHGYTIATASNITRTDAGATVLNNGSFVVKGAGTSTVSGAFTNNGTVSVGQNAVLNLDAGQQILNGNVNGAGTLNLGFAHDTTLNTATLTVAAISINGGNGGGTVRLAKDLTYAGRFTFSDQFGTLDVNGRTLTLTGPASLTGGIVDGPGTLKITGTATVANVGFGYGGSPVTVQNTGTITQTGSVSLNGTLVNDAGHAYTIATASNITRTDAGATILNNGSFVVTGAGTSTVSGAFTNNGTVSVGQNAVLNLDAGQQILNGNVNGAGTLNLGFAHDTTLNTATLTVAAISINGGNGGGTVRLAKDLTYAGRFTFSDQFGTLDVNGHTLTLTGPASLTGGILDGPGTLRLGGETTLGVFSVGYNGSAATLRNSGSATQVGFLSLNGTLLNDTGKTYTIGEVSDITVSGAGGSVVNNGTFRDAAAGTSRVDAAFTNNGLVRVEAGTLIFKSLINVGIVQGVLTEDGGRITVTPDAAGHVTQTGGTGDNLLEGGAGADTLRGGQGDDSYVVNNAGDQIFEASGGGVDKVFASTSYALQAGQEIEGLQLLASTGSANLNLTGNEISQSLVGNNGNNVLDGGVGRDAMTGRGGNDTYIVDNLGDRVSEAVGGGRDTVLCKVSYALAAGQEIEALQLLTSTGSSRFNLSGNEFGQSLVGNSGANVLDGKGGADVLTGRGGADSFLFSTALGAGNVDHITDFAAEDTIRLAKSVFTALAAGQLPASAFKDLGVSGATVDADDRIVYDSRTGALAYDADGSAKGAAVTFAILDNHAHLTAADILIA